MHRVPLRVGQTSKIRRDSRQVRRFPGLIGGDNVVTLQGVQPCLCLLGRLGCERLSHLGVSVLIGGLASENLLPDLGADASDIENLAWHGVLPDRNVNNRGRRLRAEQTPHARHPSRP